MSFGKLYKLELLGFTENTVTQLIHFFEVYDIGGIIDYYDILKNTRQKNKINELIDLLIQNKIIEDITEDIEDYENKQFKILVERRKTPKDKRAEKYLNEMDLYNQTKDLIMKRLDSMIDNKKDGWILFIDFANSSKQYTNANYILRNKIIKETIDVVLLNLIDKYRLSYKGFDISNTTKGDEIEFYFFDEKSCDKFIKDFLKIYTNNIYKQVIQFNKDIITKNKLEDFLYLKIFKAHSKTVDYSEKNNQMPSFKTMDAIIKISKIEKAFKEQNLIKDLKLTDIDMYFYLSDKNKNELSKIEVKTKDIGNKVVYYKLF
jgi:hypothetical protein